ncbi:unnamed protein product [Clonostachys byssicola]|uniref:HNH nuclease domain-containing protein n=1 Tax=Clonostachys byssicola TaxID=160290 RepID=A0A9N9US32_9HYPO|nr:unnamed protein product [Clonostachys byssicola]
MPSCCFPNPQRTKSHTIPQAQNEWWQRNIAYTANPELSADIHCVENEILLRRDLHKLRDDHQFVTMPKAGKWVIDVLWKSPSDEFEIKYHNLELQLLSGVKRPFPVSFAGSRWRSCPRAPSSTKPSHGS